MCYFCSVFSPFSLKMVAHQIWASAKPCAVIILYVYPSSLFPKMAVCFCLFLTQPYTNFSSDIPFQHTCLAMSKILCQFASECHHTPCTPCQIITGHPCPSSRGKCPIAILFLFLTSLWSDIDTMNTQYINHHLLWYFWHVEWSVMFCHSHRMITLGASFCGHFWHPFLFPTYPPDFQNLESIPSLLLWKSLFQLKFPTPVGDHR